MKVAVGSDHAGFVLKKLVTEFLKTLDCEVLDQGTFDESPTDYADYAKEVAYRVSKKEADRGIVICGSGVGASIAANKVKGVMAAICHDTYSAHQGVEHDDMNVLALGSRIIGSELAKELCRAFINARFSNEERHVRRVSKVKKLEEQFGE